MLASMLSSTDSLCSCGGGIDGGSDDESGLDLLRDKDGNYDESSRYQSTSTSVVHSPPTQFLPTSFVLASQPGKEILMPLGYRAVMNRWRAAPSFT
nr:hypothetical protein [Tanacetum cinerariifolium]